MKKIFIPVLISFFLFSGCSPNLNNLANEPDSSSIDSTKDNSAEFSQNDKNEHFPDYFNNLVASYNDSAEKYDLNYKHPISPIFHEEQDSDYYSYSYNFGIQSLTEPSSCETVEIKETLEGDIVKSFKINFPSDFDNETIRDFLLATIMMANAGIDHQEAMSDMQTLINSFDGTGYSDIYKTEDYCILLNNENYLVPSTALYVMHNSEINPNIDIDAYTGSTFEVISSPLNAGLSVSINATIYGSLNTDSYGNSTLDVVDDSGNIFSLHFSYPKFCIDINSSKEYVFYGVITSSSGLRLEHFSECEN